MEIIKKQHPRGLHSARLLAAAALAFVVSSCGGGSSGGDSGAEGSPPESTLSTDINVAGMQVPASEPMVMTTTVIANDGNLTDASNTTPLGADPGQTVDESLDQGNLIPRAFASSQNVPASITWELVELTNRINDSLILPRDIIVNFTDCGSGIGPNAFYVSNGTPFGLEAGPNIVMCHELTALKFSFFNSSDLDTYLAIAWVLMHELGHALIDQLELPFIGLEESNADAIASVLTGEGGFAEASLLASFFFEQQGVSPFTDSHRSGPQRFGDLACLAVGAEPELLSIPRVAEIAQQLFDAGRNCAEEYQRQVTGLSTILGPFVRGGLGDPIDVPFEFVGMDEEMQIQASESASQGGFQPSVWQLLTQNTNLIYVILDVNSAQAAMLADFQGDEFDRGDDCYIISASVFNGNDFTVDGNGSLLLEGIAIGTPIDPAQLPAGGEC